MLQDWDIVLANFEERRKVAMVEGRARGPQHSGADNAVEFSLTFYPDQASLNVPASPQGRAFIARIIAILGAPILPPTVKCSFSWGMASWGPCSSSSGTFPPTPPPLRPRT
jgi:hypothetical protein